MSRLSATALPLLLFVVLCITFFANKESSSKGQMKSSPVQVPHSKQLVLDVLETDSGVGGTNQFVFLRVFSDRTVEFHPKRSDDFKEVPVSEEKISEAQLDIILALVKREDVVKLLSTFKSTYTPIDFNWVLDFKIPRGPGTQLIQLVNFNPDIARQNHKPYPEALVRLACSVLNLRRKLKADTPYSDEECKEFVPIQ